MNRHLTIMQCFDPPRRLATLLAAFSCWLLLIDFSVCQAQVRYVWVPEAESRGSGYLLFDDQHIAATANGQETRFDDVENFVAQFDQPSVLQVIFGFDNGFISENALNFSGDTTLQSSLLSTRQVGASAGRIRNWSFEYVNQGGSFLSLYSSVDPNDVFCVVLPCPFLGADVTFSGAGAGEQNFGDFHYQRYLADFDLDQDVDLADLALWQSGYSLRPANYSDGDADGNLASNGADFLIWQQQSGSGVAPLQAATTSVPEPSSLVLACIAAYVVPGLMNGRR